MLSSEDEARIRAEEIYRTEVRDDIAAARHSKTEGARARFWRFVNSSLGIWFLSTLVVGTGSWLFSVWRDARTARRENTRTIQRLDIEITTRLDQFASSVNGLLGRHAYETALAALENPVGNPYAASAYPEFRERGLTSLIRELYERSPPEERKELARALVGAKQLARISASNLERRIESESARATDMNFDQLQDVFAIARNNLRLRRWPASPLK
jgi:hypothetical protein